MAEAFVIEPPEAGTSEAGEKPLTATLGQSLEAGSQYTAKVDIYLVTPPESGATECGAGI